MFYANLTIRDGVLFSRVNGVDIKMICDELASFLDILYLRFDLYNESLSSFNQFPEGHSREYASRLILNNLDLSLILNEDITISHIEAKFLQNPFA